MDTTWPVEWSSPGSLGSAAWSVVTAESTTGESSLRSGGISDSQSTSVKGTFHTDGPASLSFSWRASSENVAYDYLYLIVDGASQANVCDGHYEYDGSEGKEWVIDNYHYRCGGSTGWVTKTYDLDAGDHTVEFVYRKDSSVSKNDDCGWLDNVQISLCETVSVALELNGDVLAEGVASELSCTTWRAYGTLPAPSKTDCRFLGWFTAAAGGDKVTDATTVTAGVTAIHAHWMARPVISDLVCQQRYPWNGLVDITFRVRGVTQEAIDTDHDEVMITKFVFTTTNYTDGAEQGLTMKTFTEADGTKVSLKSIAVTNGTYHYVWNAAADLRGADALRYGEVRSTVTTERKLLGVQLWAGGPYWAECNVVTKVYGTLTVMTAGNPFVGGADIDPTTPDEGDLSAAFSGVDTEAVYDGVAYTIATNDLVAAVTEKAIGEAVIRFWSNGTGGAVPSRVENIPVDTIWIERAPGFVNVGMNVVWYKVSATGCADYVHAAKVVITKRPLTAEMIADIPDQVFDDEHPATESAVVVTDGEPSIITADDYTVTYSQNTAPGEATVTVTATAGGNYQGSASKMFRIDHPVAARLRGTIVWKYLRESGTWFAQIKVVCTSGLVRGIEDLRFAFADRFSDGTRSAALWATLSHGAVATTMTAKDGATYRYVALDASRIRAENSEVVYGVRDLSAATIPYAECVIELYVRKHVDPVTGNEAAANVDNFVGYLTWMSNGMRVWLPVVADAAASVAVQSLEAARAPVSAASINTLLAINVPPLTADSAPYCALTAFMVDGEEIVGRIAVGLADGDGSRRSGSIGPNARVTVLGAETLGGAFTECATVTVNADGTFVMPKPARARFFKVRIEVAEVVR